MWLAANSTFKADSDLAKYEKARKLKVSADAWPQYLDQRDLFAVLHELAFSERCNNAGWTHCNANP